MCVVAGASFERVKRRRELRRCDYVCWAAAKHGCRMCTAEVNGCPEVILRCLLRIPARSGGVTGGGREGERHVRV